MERLENGVRRESEGGGSPDRRLTTRRRHDHPECGIVQPSDERRGGQQREAAVLPLSAVVHRPAVENGRSRRTKHTGAICRHHGLCTVSASGSTDVGGTVCAGGNGHPLNISPSERMPAHRVPEKLSPKVDTDARVGPCRPSPPARRGVTRCSARSVQRAALPNTHRMSWTQRQPFTRLHSAFFERFRLGMSGALLDYCSSACSRTWRPIERPIVISLVVASLYGAKGLDFTTLLSRF